MATSSSPVVTLDGQSLSVSALVRVASRSASVQVDRSRLAALSERQQALLDARARGSVYGANTGVGANRHERVAGGDGAGEDGAGADEHGLRLLRSHCAAAGPEEDDVTVRATMAVRLNQLLAGGSGIAPQVAAALADALERGAVPHLHRWGAIGTGDLSALAELGLTLAGERPWRSGQAPTVTIGPTDALPLISSNAMTVAVAALATAELQVLLRASTAVTALSFLALQGNAQAYDDAVHRARPHPAQVDAAARLRRLVAGSGPAARVQDPFGLRVAPQVLAPALHTADQLERVLATELNAAAENPLVGTHGVHHHGQFHTATLAAALDATRAALFPALSLSAARVSLLLRPEVSGLRAFLAAGPAGSSGLMITEYVVQDVLAELRARVLPTTAGTLSISLGQEEHASFSSQGARALRTAVELAPTVLATELVAAVRALRMAPDRLGRSPARAVFDLVAAQLSTELEDRTLGPDLERAAALLPLVAGAAGEAVGDGL